MIAYYDLHIHSVLSPCADYLMTPNNIFNMAHIKGLNIISITDHNSLKQLPTCIELIDSYDFLFIPGVEVTVKEGFDVLVYFKNMSDALAFDLILDQHRHKVPVDLSIYHEQTVCDIYDEPISVIEDLLSLPLNLSIEDLIDVLKPYETIMVYAHIDRKHRSGKAYIETYPLDGIEYQKVPLNKGHKTLHSSDAHQITDIKEKTEHNQLELEALTIDAFFRYFKS